MDLDSGHVVHCPEKYFVYFRRHNVSTIIRLNKKAYDSNRFIQAGFDHSDLFFIDGGIPNDRICNKFMSVCENAKGAIAVHCKGIFHYFSVKNFIIAIIYSWLRKNRNFNCLLHYETLQVYRSRGHCMD